MTTVMTPEQRHKASSAYFRHWAANCCPSDMPTVIDAAFVAEAEAIRHEVRRAEGGGGMCHVVSEILQVRYGFERLSVAYLDPHGAMICAAHVVNVLSDGSILDTTRDQFGEGFSVSLIRPDDPEIRRYRPEFYEDYHPGHEVDEDGWLDPWGQEFDGRLDYDLQDDMRKARGPAWWVTDRNQYESYRAAQRAFEAPAGLSV